jgi:hydrogenase assembly chaperone HypC/HupF
MNPLPGRIIEIYNEESNRIGLVEFDGKRRAIYLSLVPEAQIGDDVLFHAGFAIERVKPNQAQADHERLARAEEDEKRKHHLETCRASRLLSELDPAQLRKLIPLAQNELFAAGDIIFHAGDRSRSLHLIAAGEVALEEVSGQQAVEVQTLHAGDAMGWSALTPGARTHFQARALSRVCTVAFPGEQLREACNQDPAIGYALMNRLLELVTERLDAMRMKLAEKSGGQITNG